MSIAPRGWSRSARCQVRDLCAAHAFAYQERYGIWGGLTERERLQAWADHFRPIGGDRWVAKSGSTLVRSAAAGATVAGAGASWGRLPGRYLCRHVARRTEANRAWAWAGLNLAHGGDVVAGFAA